MPELNDNIISILRSGPMSAAELARRLDIDATTVSRRLNAMGPKVIKAGDGRSTRWYLRRRLSMPTPAIKADVDVLPIYRVDEHGQAEKIAHLHVVYPADSYLAEYFRKSDTTDKQQSEWTFFESLPWWVTDMRPQGFLGRSFAQQLRAQGQPVDSDPNRWSEDTTLSVLASYPQDHVGNLLIGDTAYTRWLNAAPDSMMSDAEAGTRADAIARGEHFDSSAKGEQPKFTARLHEGECLIKFSGQVKQLEIDSPANRWADLLHAEALASAALNQSIANIAATSRSFQVNQRTLLASRRFDRTDTGGRLGVISWTSLDLEFVGKANEPWPVIADLLHQQNIISEVAATHSKISWAFGQLIANSDMHLGNISCVNRGGRPYELAPIYDMLPMHFAPKSTGDLPATTYAISIHPSVPRICWEAAFPAAIAFWKRVSSHDMISDHFKVLAAQQLEITREFESIIRKMA
ncbi:type II toxin-antitoxin system HipA family toxin YjjJ [Pseudidiomarina aestuarii]|uniref:type II toxin-antitoxin system HipA family toxin YjjJ n=1 Tax=Pseudidiomarina aestuarii TaxID=624146 RepID=UPI003A982ACC